MSLTINDVDIQATDDMKVLGMTIDHRVKFDKHITYLYEDWSSAERITKIKRPLGLQ